MKEIRMAGKLECHFNNKLKRYLDNVGDKLNDLVDVIKLVPKDGYNLSVDISKLEKEEGMQVKGKKRKSPRITIKTW